MSEEVKDIVVHTERLNRNGVFIDTDGIGLSNFMKNPIMLYNHNTDKAIGTWTDIKFEGSTITAKPVFAETELAKEVKSLYNGKVLKGASIGLSVDKANIREDNIFHITKSDLVEISIVSVPANPDTLQMKLYDNKGNELKNYNNNKKMSTEKESKVGWLHSFASKLGINSNDTDELSINAKIEELKTENAKIKAENEELKTENSKLKEDKAIEIKAKATKLVEQAIENKVVKEADKEEYIKMSVKNYDLMAGVFEKAHAKIKEDTEKPRQTIKSMIENGKTKEEDVKMTFDWLRKHNTAELRRIKKEEPELYAQLLKDAEINQ